ncbi:MAG: hypothetical protein KatS3mg055_0040 [Chloroflexus sp.]|nr:MAG: hypothetical protein KatS3mg055_0040 [Chloroflexus sp.]
MYLVVLNKLYNGCQAGKPYSIAQFDHLVGLNEMVFTLNQTQKAHRSALSPKTNDNCTPTHSLLHPVGYRNDDLRPLP